MRLFKAGLRRSLALAGARSCVPRHTRLPMVSIGSLINILKTFGPTHQLQQYLCVDMYMSVYIVCIVVRIFTYKMSYMHVALSVVNC